jgi:XisH protein
MAKDKIHQAVRDALEIGGWEITHDPYTLKVGRRKGFIDLGAKREIIAAVKGTEKIAVEVKSFLGQSDLDDFEYALGQFIIYFNALEEVEPERLLYLALPKEFYDHFFDDPFFEKLAKRYSLKFIVFDVKNSTIEQWIK